MQYAVGQSLLLILDIFFWIIIIQVVASWLIAFGVLNLQNQYARQIVEGLQRITDPVYRPLQKVIPPIAGLDLTPIIIIFAITILKNVVAGAFFY